MFDCLALLFRSHTFARAHGHVHTHIQKHADKRKHTRNTPIPYISPIILVFLLLPFVIYLSLSLDASVFPLHFLFFTFLYVFLSHSACLSINGRISQPGRQSVNQFIYLLSLSSPYFLFLCTLFFSFFFLHCLLPPLLTSFLRLPFLSPIPLSSIIPPASLTTFFLLSPHPLFSPFSIPPFTPRLFLPLFPLDFP